MSRQQAATAIVVATVLLVTGAVVENQGRRVSGVVVHAPIGLETAGAPVANARVEYRESGFAERHAATTDDRGYFEFEARQKGIVTASKEGLATISVGWPPRFGAQLRIELPQAATWKWGCTTWRRGGPSLRGSCR